MTLTLRIENFDRLENGGPTFIGVTEKGCHVGRGGAMDWILPDPARHVSSHHFDITFSQGAFFLTDVSTNGTFLQGQQFRLDGPHRINSGDRFTVGPYIVRADVAKPEMPRANPASPSMLQTPPYARAAAPPPDDNDPWSSFGAAPEPVNPLPVQSNPRHLDDIGQDFVPAAVPMPAPEMRSQPPVGGFQPSPFQQPPMGVPQATPMANGAAIIAAFCEGAGLSPDAYANADPVALARDLGKVVRSSATEIMTMLQDRAAVKQFTKGGERTMRSATGNNPMKFLPDAEQALEIMFLKHRDGFMKGPDGFENALRDIRRHQTGVFAALQPALARVLAGLSPDEIEDSAGTGLLGGASKSKSWDTFVERWDAKANAGDNGMLDAFLDAFSKAYAGAVGKADP